MCAPAAVVWKLVLLLPLICRDVLAQTAEQLSEINSVCEKMPTLSLDLCPGGCADTSCHDFNPCDSLSCAAHPGAVCYFCCCDSKAEWTIDGKKRITCPVAQRFRATITSTGSGGTTTTTIIRGSNIAANPAIPVPLVSLFETMLPKLKDTALSSCSIVAGGEEPESLDCQEVLRECRRFPWKDECNSCGGPG